MTDETIFTEALALTDPTQRRAYLERVCTNPEQRQRIEELLIAVEGSNALDRPPVELAVTGAHITQRQTDEPSSFAGDRIGPYKLLEKIGEGGMGEVWVADQQEPIKRRVAIKLIKPGMDSRSVLGRFEAERQALAVMDHPNIAKVLDAGTTLDGRPYFVMELVKGTPITEFADARKLTPRQRLELFIPVCQAIQHAHMKGIIHRDIKPSNVLVALHDDVAVPKVIDFGVAKAVGQQLTEKTIYTGFGSLVGTPAYMAPEQATFNQLDVDTRADVYALGVLLYELLAGSPPIEKARLKQAALDEVLRIVREEEPPRPSQRLSTDNTRASIAAVRGTEPSKLSALMKGEIDWIVMKSLEKDRNRRYESANSFAADVQRYLAGEPVQAVPPSLGYRLKKMYRKNKAAVLTGSAFALLIILASVVGVFLAVKATNAEAIAKKNETNALKAEAEAKGERDKTTETNAELERIVSMQRKTRYAAEMNLLQSAYNAKDMESVKKLLLAQIPKAGEQDDRGPEWHYWDRKLNSFEKELTLPIVPNLELSDNSATVISPDASQVASLVFEKSQQVDDGKAPSRPSRFLLTLWDTETGKLKHKQEWDAKTIFPEEEDKIRSQISIKLKFIRDGKSLLIQMAHSKSDNLGLGAGAPPPMRCDLCWDSETNNLKTLFKKTAPKGKLHVVGYRPAVYSHDLSLQAIFDTNNEPTLIVTRLEDGKELLRKKFDKDLIGHCAFSPDGKYLVGIVSKLREGSWIQLWKIENGEVPIWEKEREDVQGTVVTIGAAPTEFLFSPDGTTVSECSYSLTGCRFDVYALDTGKKITSRLFLDSSESSLTNRTTRGEGSWWFALHTNTNLAAIRTKTGYVIQQTNELKDGGQPYRLKVDSADGPAFQMAFRPSGELVTLHGVDRVTRVRSWPKVPTIEEQTARALESRLSKSSFCISSDGTRIASLMQNKERESMIGYTIMDNSGKKLKTVVGDECPFSGLNFINVQSLRYAQGSFYLICSYTTFDDTKKDQPQHQTVTSVYDLDKQKEVARFPQPVGVSRSESYLNPENTRILICTMGSDGGDGSPTGFARYKIVGAKLYEFPSLRLISELEIPKDNTLQRISLTESGWQGFPDFGMKGKLEAPSWDTLTGKFLGNRSGRFSGELSSAREDFPIQVGGQRLIRLRNQVAQGSPLYRIEVWDTLKQSETDKPLFAFDEPIRPKFFLSPNGKRLVVLRLDSNGGFTRVLHTLTMYCTDTGRTILTIPQVRIGLGRINETSLALWSADSQQFWTGINYEGKLEGFDFRPRRETQP